MERCRSLLCFLVLFLLSESINCVKRRHKHGQKAIKNRSYNVVVAKEEIEEDGANCDATDENFNNFWSFKESLQKDKLDIKRTRFCRFTRSNEGCVHKYTRVCGHCPLGDVMINLFGDIDLMVLSQKFIVPGKFQVTAMEANQCNGMKVSVTIRNQQEHTLACNFLELKKGGTITVSWENDQASSFQQFELSGGGPITSNGGADYSVKIVKEMKTDFVNVSLIPPSTQSVSCTKYAGLFGLEFKSALTGKVNHISNTLQLDTLSFENPESKGIVFPGESFEFHLLGNIETNALLSGQGNSFLVIQYFKVEKPITSGKPVPMPPVIPRMALYVPFGNTGIRSKVQSITGLQLPALTLFTDVKSYAFCAANKGIFMLLNEGLTGIVAALQTEGDKVFTEAGVRFVFKKSGMNRRVQRRSGISPEVAKFSMLVNERQAIISTPDQVTGKLGQLTNVIWSRGEDNFKKVRHTTGASVMLHNIVYEQGATSSSVTVAGNLTAPLTVAGPFVLDNVTLEYEATKTNSEGYGAWALNTSSSNMFLEAESAVQIVELENGDYKCIGDARIFSTGQLLNRTGASIMKEKYVPYYSKTNEFSFVDLKYHALFGAKDSAVRIKGRIFLTTVKDNLVEIIYWHEKSAPKLLLGMVFNNARLDRVINHVFGEVRLTQTWMTFDKIGIVSSSQNHDKDFDEEILNKVPKTDEFHVITHGLQLDKYLSNDTYKVMAYFLDNHFGKYMDLEYHGHFSVSKNKETNEAVASFSMKADIKGSVCPKEALTFEDMSSEIKSIAVGEVSRLRCTMNFQRINLKIPGVIFVDGSGQLTLKIAVGVTMQSDKIIDVNYVMLSPLHILSPLPSFICAKSIHMKSGMQIGTNPQALLHFSKGNSQQIADVDYGKFTTFITKKTGIKFDDILSAFKMTDQFRLLRGAKCFGQTTVAYTGGIRKLWIPDIDETIKEGLNFFCALELPSGPLLDTKCTLLNTDEMTCRIQFPAALNVSRGNFRMSFSPTNDSFGPTLVAKFKSNRVDAKLKGYVQLPGIESTMEIGLSDKMGQDGSEFSVTYEGDMYDELKVKLDLTLTAQSTTQFNIQYTLAPDHLSNQKIQKILNGKITEYYEMYKRALENARKNKEEVAKHLGSFQQKLTKLQSKEKMYKLQIRALSSGIEEASLTLSKDCLDECRTISLPSLSLDETCASQAASNARCYRWGAENLKAIDVIQLIKCQAKKMSAYLSAKANVTSLELLMHGLVKAKAEIMNQEIFIEEYTKLKDIAEETSRLVDERLVICKDLEDIKNAIALLWFDLKEFKSSGSLASLSPPSFPFDAKWAVLGKNYEGVLNVTFLMPFMSSLADEIVESTFATQDIRFAIDEANLRYQQQKRMQHDIKQVLKKRQPDSEGAARRSQMSTREYSTLLREASRAIPQFSLLSDSSIMGYRRLSPWARLKRDQSIIAKRDAVSQRVSGNLTTAEGDDAAHCTTAKQVLNWFHHVSNGLNDMVENYQYGKEIVGSAKRSLYRKLSSAESFISHHVNTTGASGKDKESMMYWLSPVKEGLAYWDKYHYKQLDKQNRNFIPMLRDELNYSARANKYGDVMSYIDYLGSTWSQAYRRENSASNKHEEDIAYLSQGLKDIFSRSITLEEAQPKINLLRGYVNKGARNIKNCR